MTRLAPTISEPPRLLKEAEAAERFGVSKPTFERLVELGLAPAPVEMRLRDSNGRPMRRWHSGQLSAAIDALAGIRSDGTAGPEALDAGAGAADEWGSCR